MQGIQGMQGTPGTPTQATTTPGLLASGLAPPGTQLPYPAIDINLRFISPISSAVGSPRLHFNQILSASTVPLAGVWVILIDIIIQMAAWFFGEDRISIPNPGDYNVPQGTVSMTLSELSNFLGQLKKGTWELPNGSGRSSDSNISTYKVSRRGVQVKSPAWLTIYLLVNGTATGRAGSPFFSLFVPIIVVEGLTGGLPILILGLIATILVRDVVPPTSSGIQPLEEQPTEQGLITLKTSELINMLKTFGGSFQK
jgi:hypothetical protein